MNQHRSNQRSWRRPNRLWAIAAGFGLLLGGSSALAATPDGADAPMLAQVEQPREQQQQQERMQQPQVGQQAQVGQQVGVQQEVRELRQEIHELRTQYAVGAFAGFVEEYQRDNRFQEQTEHYAQRGLRLLVSTIGEFITPEDQQLKQQHQQLTQRVDQLAMIPVQQQLQQRQGQQQGQQQQGQIEPEMVRELFIETANLLVNVQQQHYPQFAQQAQQLRQLVQQIQPQELGDQAQQINTFFQTSSLVLERMAQSPTDVIGGGPLEQDQMMDGQQPMDHQDQQPGYQQQEREDF
jgi:hypothetical protein